MRVKKQVKQNREILIKNLKYEITNSMEIQIDIFVSDSDVYTQNSSVSRVQIYR